MDRNFKEFLSKIFGDKLWDEYERQHPGELQRMMYDVSVLKENVVDVEISCQYNLGGMANKIKDIEEFFKTVQGASWNNGSIKISKDKVSSFFAGSLNGITKSLREILKNDINVEYILLVGGYAQSKILRQHIQNQFGRQCKVLCPCNPQEAIMKGALMFGRNPWLVASRKSAFTYGVGTCRRFDESKHSVKKKFTNIEGEWCQDIFSVLVEGDEEVGCNETRQHSFTPIERDQTEITFSFYRTERKIQCLTYVDDWGMEKIGSITLNSTDTTKGMNRRFKLEIKFGSTEMTATATDKESGSTVKTDLDFMVKS